MSSSAMLRHCGGVMDGSVFPVVAITSSVHRGVSVIMMAVFEAARRLAICSASAWPDAGVAGWAMQSLAVVHLSGWRGVAGWLASSARIHLMTYR